MSTTFLCTDTLIIVSAGLVYGWEGALYAAIALFAAGLATDYVLEGPSVIRTAMIITDKPEEISKLVFDNLQRGVTSWTIQGQYTGAERTMLYVTIARSQVRELKDEVSSADPNAFRGHRHGSCSLWLRLPGGCGACGCDLGKVLAGVDMQERAGDVVFAAEESDRPARHLRVCPCAGARCARRPAPSRPSEMSPPAVFITGTGARWR